MTDSILSIRNAILFIKMHCVTFRNLNQVINSRLSFYICSNRAVVGMKGFEPMTLALKERYSNRTELHTYENTKIPYRSMRFCNHIYAEITRIYRNLYEHYCFSRYPLYIAMHIYSISYNRLVIEWLFSISV